MSGRCRIAIIQLLLASSGPTTMALTLAARCRITGSLVAMKMETTGEENAREDDMADFPGGISSSFQGAGRPRAQLPPQNIPSLLMEALKCNDIPALDAGLNSMWDFAGGNTQYIFDYNRTSFIESAHETASEFPTSFYGVAINGKSWEMESPLNRVGGSNGWIATQVMKTISSDGRMRRWQWELRQNRRPPDLGVWLVESIASSDRKGKFEPGD